MSEKVTNVVVAGLGGQGVLTASDIISRAAFNAGYDVKKSEVHGMSQRGGSVASDIRFGPRVLSPMVPDNQADYLVVMTADEVETNRRVLRPGGVLITPDDVPEGLEVNPRSMNVILSAVLSTTLNIDEKHWIEAIKASLKPALHEANVATFVAVRKAGTDAGPKSEGE